jgi:hypothetical protein
MSEDYPVVYKVYTREVQAKKFCVVDERNRFYQKWNFSND